MAIASTNGKEYELTLDWDAIESYEKEHADWDIVSALQSSRNRICDMNFLVGFVLVDGVRFDGGWKDFIKTGFSPEDILEVYRSELQMLGFISAEDPSAE